MEWAQVTDRLLGFLPSSEPGVSRYTWELGSKLKDYLIELDSITPTMLLVLDGEALIWEFEPGESVVIRIIVRSTQVVVAMLAEGSLKLRTLFDGPFEVLEQLMKGITEWLHNLLRSSTT